MEPSCPHAACRRCLLHRSDDLAKCPLQDSSLGCPSAWSGGEHEPYSESSRPGGIRCVALFRSWTRRRRSLDLPKISLGSGPTVRRVDIMFIFRRSHGCRPKSELAALRNWGCSSDPLSVRPDVTQQHALCASRNRNRPSRWDWVVVVRHTGRWIKFGRIARRIAANIAKLPELVRKRTP